jgi:HlyD family secretion protein
VLTVPESAVMYDAQKNPLVEIPDKSQKEGKRKVPVKIGLSNGSVTEIISGLKEGQQVVLQQ